MERVLFSILKALLQHVQKIGKGQKPLMPTIPMSLVSLISHLFSNSCHIVFISFEDCSFLFAECFLKAHNSADDIT